MLARLKGPSVMSNKRVFMFGRLKGPSVMSNKKVFMFGRLKGPSVMSNQKDLHVWQIKHIQWCQIKGPSCLADWKDLQWCQIKKIFIFGRPEGTSVMSNKKSLQVWQTKRAYICVISNIKIKGLNLRFWNYVYE